MTHPAFPPIDWSKSILGRDVWEAWNQLESALHALGCAQLSQLSACDADVREKRRRMAFVLRDRDRYSEWRQT